MDDRICVWSADRRLLSTFVSHDGSVHSITFSPDGQRLLAGTQVGTVQIWDVPQRELLSSTKVHDGRVWTVRFSPDGRHVLTCSDDGAAFAWDADLQRATSLWRNAGALRYAAWSRDNLVAIPSSSGTVRVTDPSGRRPLDLPLHGAFVNSVSFDPAGEHLLTASADGTAALWDLDGKLQQRFVGHRGFVNSAVFSPDGSLVLTASKDGTTRLWRLDGELVFSLAEPEGHFGASY